ncbi:lysylphosphatidylglycerol synthase transmembrane domain-containing protein [Halegenticoccus tardaugens]|uniref:lysylphosphatidylglycerol synthase transmembrane domain-containing protein n=1 Tax=Halegenticoccus tardaugens TaxID=2071624 RepID=UPI00100B737D|nr:lysylphosphatidylglycerol synthase transmembrane domain-containing protein [Halegenticoccus tardaugens]
MDRDRVPSLILGVAGSLVILAALLHFVGVEDLLSVLSTTDISDVLFVVIAVLGWLFAWGLALRTVLSVLDVSLSSVKAFFVICGAMCANNVTPFGQAGGEPISAMLISKTADTDYEKGLAAIASVDTLNFIPSILLALLGAAYFATKVTFSTNLRVATGVLVFLSLAIPSGLYLGWTNRETVETSVAHLLTTLVPQLTQRLPYISVIPGSDLRQRVRGFFRALERVATNPTDLALALTFSLCGWLCQVVALWLAFRAIGTPIALAVVMFAVPLGAIAGITPLPGGVGGIESVLIAVLLAAPLPLMTKAIAFAAVVIYRGAIFWTPTIIGGVFASIVGVNAFYQEEV